ncbi:hypothetical protein P280DRAFT_484571 [Massarina eburnea CBS 473.64]|uniref:J domain-containing protein n=1 Tax=Massarina eburnea CBS 473.64 TaxID=1395130 RepID=A0A6A6RJK7_9PLEO|nr:hypothetical protein P280DRAFT_484571 [Massarina eburnea CBS 473.64]
MDADERHCRPGPVQPRAGNRQPAHNENVLARTTNSLVRAVIRFPIFLVSHWRLLFMFACLTAYLGTNYTVAVNRPIPALSTYPKGCFPTWMYRASTDEFLGFPPRPFPSWAVPKPRLADQFRKLNRCWHPDKSRTLPASEQEVRAKAFKLIQEVTEAYDNFTMKALLDAKFMKIAKQAKDYSVRKGLRELYEKAMNSVGEHVTGEMARHFDNAMESVRDNFFAGVSEPAEVTINNLRRKLIEAYDNAKRALANDIGIDTETADEKETAKMERMIGDVDLPAAPRGCSCTFGKTMFTAAKTAMTPFFLHDNPPTELTGQCYCPINSAVQILKHRWRNLPPYKHPLYDDEDLAESARKNPIFWLLRLWGRGFVRGPYYGSDICSVNQNKCLKWVKQGWYNIDDFERCQFTNGLKELIDDSQKHKFQAEAESKYYECLRHAMTWGGELPQTPAGMALAYYECKKKAGLEISECEEKAWKKAKKKTDECFDFLLHMNESDRKEFDIDKCRDEESAPIKPLVTLKNLTPVDGVPPASLKMNRSWSKVSDQSYITDRSYIAEGCMTDNSYTESNHPRISVVEGLNPRMSQQLLTPAQSTSANSFPSAHCRGFTPDNTFEPDGIDSSPCQSLETIRRVRGADALLAELMSLIRTYPAEAITEARTLSQCQYGGNPLPSHEAQLDALSGLLDDWRGGNFNTNSNDNTGDERNRSMGDSELMDDRQRHRRTSPKKPNSYYFYRRLLAMNRSHLELSPFLKAAIENAYNFARLTRNTSIEPRPNEDHNASSRSQFQSAIRLMLNLEQRQEHWTVLQILLSLYFYLVRNPLEPDPRNWARPAVVSSRRASRNFDSLYHMYVDLDEEPIMVRSEFLSHIKTWVENGSRYAFLARNLSLGSLLHLQATIQPKKMHGCNKNSEGDIHQYADNAFTHLKESGLLNLARESGAEEWMHTLLWEMLAQLGVTADTHHGSTNQGNNNNTVRRSRVIVVDGSAEPEVTPKFEYPEIPQQQQYSPVPYSVAVQSAFRSKPPTTSIPTAMKMKDSALRRTSHYKPPYAIGEKEEEEETLANTPRPTPRQHLVHDRYTDLVLREEEGTYAQDVSVKLDSESPKRDVRKYKTRLSNLKISLEDVITCDKNTIKYNSDNPITCEHRITVIEETLLCLIKRTEAIGEAVERLIGTQDFVEQGQEASQECEEGDNRVVANSTAGLEEGRGGKRSWWAFNFLG